MALLIGRGRDLSYEEGHDIIRALVENVSRSQGIYEALHDHASYTLFFML